MSQSHGSTWRKASEGRKPGSGTPHRRNIKPADNARQPRDRNSGAKSGKMSVSRGTGRQDPNTLMQELKPTVWIGKQGCTETIIDEVVAQLKNRKVIKVKWLQNTEIIPEDLARATGAHLLGVRGRTLVLEERRRL